MDDAPPAVPQQVCAVVLNWNSADDTIACVAALGRQSYPHCRVLVVDNGSTDGSLQRLGAALPGVDLLALEDNFGYAGGNNRGIARALDAGCAFVWLVNPDTRVAPDALAALLAAAADHPSAGLFGPMVYTRETPPCILSAGGVLAGGCVAEHRGLGEADRGQFAAAEVDFVSGCALLARLSLLKAIGPLDESFFAYHEEVDWAVRARRAGFAVRWVPGARVHHPDTRRRDADSPLVTYYITRNTLRFIRKHRLGGGVLAGQLVRHLRTLLSWSVRPKWRHKRRQRDALALALLDFARGRAGRARHLPP